MKYTSITEGKFSGALSKGLFIDGNKAILSALFPDDYSKDLTWKEYKALKVKEEVSPYLQDQIILAFDKTLNKQGNQGFNKRIEINQWLRHPKNKTFEEKVDKYLSLGLKFPKSGIKIY